MRFLVYLIVTLLTVSGAWAQGVTQIDLTQVEGEVQTIVDDQVQVMVVEKVVPVPLSDVSKIQLMDSDAPDIWWETGKRFLQTTRGDVLRFDWLVFDGDDLTVTADLLGERGLALADLRGVYLPSREQTGAGLIEEAEQLGIEMGTNDRLLVQEEERLLAVEGVLESVDLTEGELRAPELTFYWREQSRVLKLDRVRAILLADTGETATDEAPAGVVLMSDGSRLTFASVAMDDATVTIDSPTFGEGIELPRDNVVAIELTPDKLVHLADLEPSEASVEGLLLDAIDYQTDRSLDGGPITLDDVSYDRGLAMHSRTVLTWELGGEYDSFVALVGIDDAVRPGGSATLELLCDGEVVETLELTGQGESQMLRRDLTDVGTFTIRVDYGPDGLESGDHVDLAMARLIKRP
jgi:hypothetical protein